MKTILFLITIAVIIIFLGLLKPLISAAKVVLLVSQEFPQVPFKPLHTITNKPKTEKVTFYFDQRKVVADLFLPSKDQLRPAVIVAMGVRTNEKDKSVLLGFCDTLARLGYVVLWPRLDDLEKDKAKFEDPQTFIKSFQFLKKRKEVDKNRISYIGFSVGSSLALVAAENPSINQKVHGVVFFGGYYNIVDYLTSLVTKTMVVDSQKIAWEPHESAIDHAKKVLKSQGLKLEDFGKKEISDSNKRALLGFSPDQEIESYKTPIFILHEKSDTFVPYTESIKLKQALEALPAGKKVSYVHHQANLFEHVQPKKGISYETVREFLGLFGFLYKVFSFL